MDTGTRQADEQEPPAEGIQFSQVAFAQHDRPGSLTLEASNRVDQQLSLGPDRCAALVVATGE